MSKIARLISTPLVMALHQRLDARREQILEDAVAIQQIAAPTFDEGRRAAFVYERFRAIGGLESLEIDALHNVYARLAGSDPTRPALLVCAHTDTVFDAQTPLHITRTAECIQGPGIGDNSLGVAALLAAAEMLCQLSAEMQAERLPNDIWFVANSREEGLGDLGGIRAVYERLAPRLSHALVIEGMALGRIYHAGIAVRRLKISCSGPGGHSWLHFGRSSAIHGLMRLGAQIVAIRPPESPRTTFNIGVIEGGQSVNSIATSASMLLDLRSASRETLAALEKTVLTLVENSRVPDLTFQVEVVGNRPAGLIPRSHALVGLAHDVLDHIGVRAIFESGSTDANVMLAAGLPAITIGITQGGNAHRLDEYIEVGPVRDGLWQLLLLIVGISTGMAT